MLRNQEFLEEYRTGTNNFVNEFYKKAFNESVEYWRAVGYFRSSSLEAFGSTLQYFLQDGGKIKLITSVALTESDSNAIEEGMNRQEVCEKRISAIIEEEFKENIGNGVSKLVKLLEIGRLDLKIAMPKTGRGIYHEKVGLFFDRDDNYIAFSGSANESHSAFESNYECIEVFTSWDDKSRAKKKKVHFETLWEATNNDCFIFDFPEALKHDIIRKVNDAYPELTLDDLFSNNPKPPKKINTKIVPRDYQKQAYEKWKENNFLGMLAMATGTGKTITAFNALQNLEQQEDKLVTIVVVPYQHLVVQWATEAKEFGIDFIMCFESSKKWSSELIEAATKYKFGEQKLLHIITTTSTYVLPKFQDAVSRLDNLCLIVDEAHNFGTKTIQKYYLENAKFRLGLSATPKRHMDEAGTEALLDYLGDIIYEFSLEKAIKTKMLTPYKYFPVLVHLTEEEQAKYMDLTQQIGKLSSYPGNDDKIKKLAMFRAKIISAAENKLPALKETIVNNKLQYSSFNLYYCAAKIIEEEEGSLRMVDKVHSLVTSLGQNVDNFTAMDSSSKEERTTLISQLKKQIIDGLVAIKCLDEGVDIPDVRRAFILSSSSNPKEFIQRRGRVLRRAKNKEFAEIYDFLVVPFGYTNTGEFKANQNYLKKELLRYREFAKLSMNYPECEEPLLDLMSEYRLLHI